METAWSCQSGNQTGLVSQLYVYSYFDFDFDFDFDAGFDFEFEFELDLGLDFDFDFDLVVWSLGVDLSLTKLDAAVLK